ncbi:radical SAM protein [Desulfococcaceae bacterium HSG7]|nr:radical SAM protein [Desulfococcaceae bacterium HSG7]
MEKILFIIPPNMTYDRFVNPNFNERITVKKTGSYGSPITDLPIGIISLSAYLKKHAEVVIKLIDFNILLNKIENFNFTSFISFYRNVLFTNDWDEFVPDIIGISTLFTTGYFNMIDIADVVRDMFPKSLVIAGGGIPTNMYKKILNESTSFDALCFGEGEKPLLELVKSHEKKKVLNTHQSWITKENVVCQDSFQYNFIHNLDEIPFYDYSILDLEAYGLSPTLTNYASFESNKNLFHIATSRGCPHRCCFCASHTVHGRKMRYHSIKRVKEDFIRLKEQYHAKIIGFQDDHLMANKKRVYEIVKMAKELNLQLYFQNGITIHALDRKLLEVLKNSGITELVLPIESGSNRVLKDIMHKPINLSIVKRVVDDCRQLEIDTHANILIGLPGETKQDIEDTREFLKSLDVTWFRIVVATPLVGSEMFDICIQKNYVNNNYIGCDFKKAVINTEDFTAEYIEQKAYLLNLELNFVENSDFRLKNYKKALEGFNNAIKVKQDHAFAYYFAAKCYEMMGLHDKYQAYRDEYNALVDKSVLWHDYATHFNLLTLS